MSQAEDSAEVSQAEDSAAVSQAEDSAEVSFVSYYVYHVKYKCKNVCSPAAQQYDSAIRSFIPCLF